MIMSLFFLPASNDNEMVPRARCVLFFFCRLLAAFVQPAVGQQHRGVPEDNLRGGEPVSVSNFVGRSVGRSVSQ